MNLRDIPVELVIKDETDLTRRMTPQEYSKITPEMWAQYQADWIMYITDIEGKIAQEAINA